MDKDKIKGLLHTYGKAWVTRDPDLITTIFTDDATYNDPHEPENIGKEAIRNYWCAKVVGQQSDIKFHLKNVWVDGYTAIAEWEAQFTVAAKRLRYDMTEVANQSRN